MHDAFMINAGNKNIDLVFTLRLLFRFLWKEKKNIYFSGKKGVISVIASGKPNSRFFGYYGR